MILTGTASVAEIRTAIDFESEYIVHVRDGDTWARPETAEYRTLHGTDVWHTARSSCAAVYLCAHGILKLVSAGATVRFTPAATREALVYSLGDRERATVDDEGRDCRCAP